MRILYGIQATGNGHLARAIELVPALRQFMDVDLLVSGTESSIDFPLEIKHLRHGLGYSFGTSGKVDIAKSIRNLKLGRFVRDVTMSPVRGYDLAISDFEPITAWSAKLYGIPSIALSHQASFLFKNSPRPHRRKRYAEFILKNYAPADRHIGIHFQSYHRQIHGPVIRQEVASLEPQKGDYIVVYLSAYCPTFLADLFRSIPQIQWRVFSNHVSQPYRIENVQVYPIASALWLESLANCGAALMGAGFEGPSEALFLGKKLLVVPMSNQYEQRCNAAALQELGVPSLQYLNSASISRLREWALHEKGTKVTIPSDTKGLVQHIVSTSMDLVKQKQRDQMLNKKRLFPTKRTLCEPSQSNTFTRMSL